jgi:aspartyl-tRNA(Asn)/glutamyl-tRNA(Gln) amidotransferase subunit A
VRIPASFCGVPGLKPTYGLVPQYPASAVETVSHVGPIARTVADVALMTDVMAGVDPRDRTSVDPVGGPFLAALGTPLVPLRIAFSPDLGYARVEAGVAALVAEAVAVFRDLGHVVDDVELDLVDPWPIEEAIWDTAMAAMHRDRLDEVRDRLDPGLLAVIETGLGRSGAELAGAYQARTRWVEGLRQRLEPYDLLLCPTLPCTAFAAGDDHPGTVAGAPVSYLGWTTFTYPFNLTGQPAATVPCGFLDGLPVGLQIVGPRFADALVLRAAAAFEGARPFAMPSL